MIRYLTLGGTLAMVAACVPADPEPVNRMSAPQETGPEVCVARIVTPAILETVTDVLMVDPPEQASDGTQVAPGQFRTQTYTKVVAPRRETPFEAPCPVTQEDPDFVMQVQRALAVRGLYAGPVHGLYDVPTRAAVEAFQTPLGYESGTLSTEAAKVLGLVALGRDGA